MVCPWIIRSTATARAASTNSRRPPGIAAPADRSNAVGAVMYRCRPPRTRPRAAGIGCQVSILRLGKRLATRRATSHFRGPVRIPETDRLTPRPTIRADARAPPA